MHVVLDPAVYVFDIVVQLYIYAIIISAVLSWLVSFNVVNSRNQLVYAVMDTLYRVTEPVLRRIRHFMPNTGALDLSPMVLILILIFVQMVIHRIVEIVPYP
jgi:YggT family protein